MEYYTILSALHTKTLQDRGDRQASRHPHDVDQCRPQSAARHHALKLFHRSGRRQKLPDVHDGQRLHMAGRRSHHMVHRQFDRPANPAVLFHLPCGGLQQIHRLDKPRQIRNLDSQHRQRKIRHFIAYVALVPSVPFVLFVPYTYSRNGRTTSAITS